MILALLLEQVFDVARDDQALGREERRSHQVVHEERSLELRIARVISRDLELLGLSLQSEELKGFLDEPVFLAAQDDEAIEALTLGSNASVIALRLDFSGTLINALQEGAGKLVNADLNQESATLLTLQTRLQLGTIGLSIAQQSDQAVFRLF